MILDFENTMFKILQNKAKYFVLHSTLLYMEGYNSLLLVKINPRRNKGETGENK